MKRLGQKASAAKMEFKKITRKREQMLQDEPPWRPRGKSVLEAEAIETAGITKAASCKVRHDGEEPMSTNKRIAEA